MSRFFVGQRVRIVGCSNPTMMHHVGKEGVIIGLSDKHPGCYYVDSALYTSVGNRGSWQPFRLEPILDQHQPCESEFKESLEKLLEGLPA